MNEYEAMLAELEDVIARLEAGKLTLEETVKAYERGVELTKACSDQLNQARGAVEKLMQTEDGMHAVPMEEVSDELV